MMMQTYSFNRQVHKKWPQIFFALAPIPKSEMDFMEGLYFLCQYNLQTISMTIITLSSLILWKWGRLSSISTIHHQKRTQLCERKTPTLGAYMWIPLIWCKGPHTPVTSHTNYMGKKPQHIYYPVQSMIHRWWKLKINCRTHDWFSLKINQWKD